MLYDEATSTRKSPTSEIVPSSTGIIDPLGWRKIALGAWEAPSWREAAIEYHKGRPTSPPLTADNLVTSEQIWRAAGQCVRRKMPHDALRTFLNWCHRRGISQQEAIPIFKTIVDKELAK